MLFSLALNFLKFLFRAWFQIDDGSHVSADEDHLENLHTVTLLLSGILAITLCVVIGIQLYEKSTVHAAVFLVMAAAASDSFSSMFELIHLSLYAHNGVGSYSMVRPSRKNIVLAAIVSSLFVFCFSFAHSCAVLELNAF